VCIKIKSSLKQKFKQDKAMLALLGKVFIFLHIFAGGVTLIAGPIAIFYNFKNTQNHRLAGKIFFYAMLFVCFSAVIGYLKRPELIFYQFLLGISSIVFVGMITGIRAMLFMKNKAQLNALDWGAALLGVATGAVMLLRAVQNWADDGELIFSILFAVFGISTFKNGIQSAGRLLDFSKISKQIWYKVHISNMLGGFIASTTAFTVNTGQSLPWVIQWFGPTLILTPIIFYFNRKLKLNKKQKTEAQIMESL
jgi:multisubunit Na+/H+ antiporter MnhB subunit